jgi:rod shape-determining protein MreB
MRVFGIHAVTGLPSSVIISSEDVNEAIGDTFCEIGEEAKKTLERTPPQLASDIYKNGVYLTGGVSQIANLAEYMSHRIGVTTYPVPDPQESGARGLVRIMNDPELRKLTFSVKDL